MKLITVLIAIWSLESCILRSGDLSEERSARQNALYCDISTTEPENLMRVIKQGLVVEEKGQILLREGPIKLPKKYVLCNKEYQRDLAGLINLEVNMNGMMEDRNQGRFFVNKVIFVGDIEKRGFVYENQSDGSIYLNAEDEFNTGVKKQIKLVKRAYTDDLKKYDSQTKVTIVGAFDKTGKSMFVDDIYGFAKNFQRHEFQ